MATQGVSLPLIPAELLRRLPPTPGLFLLDGGGTASWGTGEALLGAEPSLVVAYEPSGAIRTLVGHDDLGLLDPFDLLERLLPLHGGDGETGRQPMSGVLCALSYDLGRWVERFQAGPADDLGLPVLLAAVHPWVLAYSYGARSYTLRSRWLDTRALARVADHLREMAHSPPPSETAPIAPPEVRANFTAEAYCDAVSRALAYIAAGDIYQVNLAQRFTAPRAQPPAALFARLLQEHPMPYAAYVDGGDWSLVSNSPECFLRRDGDAIATLPIKGTRPRGATAGRDADLIAELVRSEKDGAEHVMIVDLERNDLGRICRPGSIGVRDFARVRSFPTLHHLESVVAGTLRRGTPMAAILRALFPGGSITGAPKIRAMEIIDELEPVARRFYTGAVGFIDGDHWARFNIAIRTAVITASTVAYHSGGAVVADSVPEDEYRETLVKARGFFTALKRGQATSAPSTAG